MRHRVKLNHLGRTASHRKAMLSNMASSLFKNKRITTTVAKAKALRVYVEPLITKSKSDSVHNRRTVFSYLRDKDAIKELFGPISEKVADRPGGYTRILKIGNRMGDNAEMAMIELVDFNEFISVEPKKAKKKSTRRRGKAKAKSSDNQAETTPSLSNDETADSVSPEDVTPSDSDSSDNTEESKKD